MRWEYQTAPVERFNQQNYFDFNATNPISSALGSTVLGTVVYNGVGGAGRGLYDPTKKDLAPRLGLAYQATDKMVVRAGFGLYYVPSFLGGGTDLGYGQSTPWNAVTSDGYTPLDNLDNPFPNGALPQTGNSLGAMTNVGYGMSGSQYNRPDPYMEQWMVGIQYAVTKNDLIDVSYVGNHGVKLAQGGTGLRSVADSGPFARKPTVAAGPQPVLRQDHRQRLRPFQSDGRVWAVTASLSGILQRQHSAAAGQFFALQRSRCELHSPLELGAESAGFVHILQVHRQHRCNNLPGWASRPFATTTTWLPRNRWTPRIPRTAWLSPTSTNSRSERARRLERTSTPWPMRLSAAGRSRESPPSRAASRSLSNDGDNNTNSFGGNQRPNLVGDPTLSNPTISGVVQYQRVRATRAIHFRQRASLHGQCSGAGPGNWDIGLQKWFKFTDEILKLQFRAEMFNAFNRVNFYAPDGNLTDSTFGVISASLPPRDIQFGMKLYW